MLLRLRLLLRSKPVGGMPLATVPCSSGAGSAIRAALSAHGRHGVRFLSATAATVFIESVDTPNENALKLLPGRPVLPSGGRAENAAVRPARKQQAPVEFISAASARLCGALLAAEILETAAGVESVMYGPDFITISKHPDAPWHRVRAQVYSAISRKVSSLAGDPQTPLVADEYEQSGGFSKSSSVRSGLGGGISALGTLGTPSLSAADAGAKAAAGCSAADSQTQDEDESEVVAMIREVLEARVRPSVQADGGDVEFISFDCDRGVVRLRLLGACRTCDSSVVTLQHGIKNMLSYYIPEVQDVERVADAEETASNLAFEATVKKLESKTGLE